ncbi:MULTISPECIES: N-acetylglucosamine-6-phosphate deacetylase [unclassified Massilia]|uniref:N-acetylglucosamine-6-phosphate deacetylase n=1 Tax=unclassified Massilia TaxID=2609279 RepID=UPI001786E3F1|nr:MULTISPECIES: N-acetylglucosamine-6-phosphate deacetylase [unclassified Massilia]MBD8531973.1 N-acetylglucosamine-6-phosphate deacetylase [Massilia sp. CFBP 13647]MBD8675413.1 N-acetylglucosamine-6-phosphate deacetylase [Massilia sp. CFBP 13721]
MNGNILTPGGWVHGTLRFGATVDTIEGDKVDPATNADDYILPGFIDLHVHGGAGRDMMEGGDAPHAIAALHARHGTTSLLATTMTAPPEDIERALGAIGAACRERGKHEARILGVHLEGPYINAAKLGAQPPFAKEATLAEVEAYERLAPLRVITVAPEIHGHLELVRTLAEEGIRVQIGHTSGSYEDGVAALEHGAAGFTHLFNAMPGLHHREPGMVGAALAHAQYAEIIPDLLHVHPGAIKVALRSIPHLFCVTDSTAAAGMPDGEYMLGRQVVHKCMGGVRLLDGTLAGSTLTMDGALRNLVKIGLSIEEASHRVSTNAADYLGETRRGRLAPGCHADFVVLDRDLNIKAVYIEGEAL